MEIVKNRNDNEFTIALKGRLDTLTAPELESVVKSELTGVTALTLDFKELDYVSSAGLRVILQAQKLMTAAHGSLVITNVSPQIMEIFDITGFADILTIR